MGAGPEKGWTVDEVVAGFAVAPALLGTARGVLAAPGVWVQGELALAADGRPVASAAPEAVRLCVVGGLLRAAAAVGVVEPLAFLVEDDAPDAKPGPPAGVAVTVSASLLGAVLGPRCDGAPLAAGSLDVLRQAVIDAVATLDTELALRRAEGGRPRLLGAIAAVNDLAETTLPVLLDDLAVAIEAARLAASALANPASAPQLRGVLETVLAASAGDVEA